MPTFFAGWDLHGDDIIPVPQPTGDEQPHPGADHPERPDQVVRPMDSGVPHPTAVAYGGDAPRSATAVLSPPAGTAVGSTWRPPDDPDGLEDDDLDEAARAVPAVTWQGMLRELERWCRATATAFGRSSVPVEDAAALLVHRMITDAVVSHEVRAQLAAKYRLVECYDPARSVG